MRAWPVRPSLSLLRVLLAVAGCLWLGHAVPGGVTAGSFGGDLGTRVEALDLFDEGLELGIEVAVEGQGAIYTRSPAVARSAASAIKTAILLDLLVVLGDQLESVPAGVESLLRPGTHPAFRGFTSEQLARCREALTGRSHLEMARIMMGRVPATNQAYNAACNVIMVKLGGPQAISKRLREVDPALSGVDINRYMEYWNGDGDNRATPASLVALYAMVSRGQVPGLDAERTALLRELALETGDGGPGSVFGKAGTLYPEPMVRVEAGFVEREGRNVVYAIMGEITNHDVENPGELFVELMAAVDTLTALCREFEPREED